MKNNCISFLKKVRLYNAAKHAQNLFHTLDKMILRTFFSTGMILIYHRVTKYETDPHKLAVTPEHFREQMLFLKKNYSIIPLSEMTRAIQNNKIAPGSISITFDDGYTDNFTEALPILSELTIPATIFITTGKIESREAFYDHENTPPKDKGYTMTSEQITLLSENPLIEIGAHTVHHPLLSSLSIEKQREEITASKKTLEEIIQKPVVAFAYPYGSHESFTKETVDEVKKAGFERACANIHLRASNNSDVLALPRIIIRDWDREEFKKHLDNA